MITFQELVNSIPENERNAKIIKELDYFYKRVLHIINDYGKKAKEPQMIFTKFYKSGSQLIADFSISDMQKERKEEYNWHLQNTSQLLFAGCLLLQNNQISIHT